MGSIAEKLSYLNGTKRLLRRRINSLGGNITLETRFRDYLLWLDRFYNAASSSVEFEILGETKQYAVNSSANILPLYDDEIVTDGVTVTVSDGGKITINGTAERDLWIKITNGMEVEYTNPRPNTHHKWYSEKITEFDEPTSIYYQIGTGGGTKASTGNAIQLGYHDNDTSPENITNQYITDFINTYPEKDIVSTINETNVTELNFVDLYLKSGNSFNTYGYIQVAYQNESNWVPNNDALPASPDNEKYFRSPDDITYTASDGTEFPVSLGDIELCGNPDPNGLPDRLFYSQGMFLIEKNISSSVFDGVSESWLYNSTADVYKGALHGDWSYTPSNYSLSNYFKNVVDSNIVDESTAGANLKNGEFAISYHSSEVDNTFYLKYTDLDEDDPMDTTAALKAWLSTHNTIIQFVIDGPDYILITPEEYPTLYAQLQAIIDYETKLKIEEKIF